MPTIRMFHGNIIDGQSHEVSAEEYEVLLAQYNDLKARAKAAAANVEQAPSANLKAARQAYEIAYQLRRDDEAQMLGRIADACEAEARSRDLKSALRNRSISQSVTSTISAIESLASAIATLSNAPHPDELPQQEPHEPIEPASLVGADLDVARIAPAMSHDSHLRYSERLHRCLDVLKGGLPTEVCKGATELVETLLEQSEAADAVNVADLKAIAAEQARRDAEREHQEQAQAEAENLPETIADLRQRIAKLEGRAS